MKEMRTDTKRGGERGREGEEGKDSGREGWRGSDSLALDRQTRWMDSVNFGREGNHNKRERQAHRES